MHIKLETFSRTWIRFKKRRGDPENVFSYLYQKIIRWTYFISSPRRDTKSTTRNKKANVVFSPLTIFTESFVKTAEIYSSLLHRHWLGEKERRKRFTFLYESPPEHWPSYDIDNYFVPIMKKGKSRGFFLSFFFVVGKLLLFVFNYLIKGYAINCSPKDKKLAINFDLKYNGKEEDACILKPQSREFDLLCNSLSLSSLFTLALIFV